MALILNIDTALDRATIALSENDEVIQFSDNDNRQDHAAWIHTAINQMMQAAGRRINELDAVALSNGPGSYTGLRIGLATAKGICYALKIPLITIPTTELLAWAVRELATDLIVPLVDARRDEVFTAVYDKVMRVKNSTYALVLSSGAFGELLSTHKILFCGNAVEKLRRFVTHPNAAFGPFKGDARDLSALSARRFAEEDFADLAYSEPFYVKDFHSPTGR
jgi:tRNA threonylcarbamoyladenosine biosynthesis protein TsaB